MILTFRPIDTWPEGWQKPKDRPGSPFSASYSDTLQKLDVELDHLRARDAFMQVDASSDEVRLDGQLRANAKVGHPGVILTIDSREHGVLVYPCDKFESRWSSDGASWQVNLRAITLGLSDLRRLERYGIAERGQQYAGSGALPPAREMGAAMTVDQAIELLHFAAPGVEWDFDDADGVRRAFRAASKLSHPDAGGDAAEFRRLAEARDLLLRGAS